MKVNKREQLFLDKLEKEGLVWNFDYIFLKTKNKKDKTKSSRINLGVLHMI